MAKITARGDREAARWKRESDGGELVLTFAGRLLYKWRAGESFRLHADKQSVEQAAMHARNLGMVAESGGALNVVAEEPSPAAVSAFDRDCEAREMARGGEFS